MIEQILEKLVDKKCNEEHQRFIKKINESISSMNIPDGLREKLNSFLLEQKHLFYRDFKSKMKIQLEESLINSISLELNKKSTNKVDQKEYSPDDQKGIGWNDRKNREWMEAYFICGKNQSKTASYLAIPKSTFHDWISSNKEMIEQEERMRMV